jgi:hypothetical protein
MSLLTVIATTPRSRQSDPTRAAIAHPNRRRDQLSVAMSSIRRQPVTLFGRRAQAAAETAREFLRRNQVPVRWVDLDFDPLAAFLSARELKAAKQPMALFADGSRLEAPENYAEPMPGRPDAGRASDYLASLCGERNWRRAPAFLPTPSTTTTTWSSSAPGRRA